MTNASGKTLKNHLIHMKQSDYTKSNGIIFCSPFGVMTVPKVFFKSVIDSLRHKIANTFRYWISWLVVALGTELQWM